MIGLPPMSAQAVRDYIAKMDRETRSLSARKRMAEAALGSHGNISPEGRTVWLAYLETFK